MPNRIRKMPQSDQHIHGQIRVDEAFLISRNGFRKAPPIRTVHGRVPTTSDAEEGSFRLVGVDTGRCHNGCAVQYKSGGLHGICLGERCAAFKSQSVCNFTNP